MPVVAKTGGRVSPREASSWLIAPTPRSTVSVQARPSNGNAAMSVPFGTGEAGLPVGVQVLAPALKEDVMFRVAAELERAATGLGQP